MNQSFYQYVNTLSSNKIAFIDVDGTLTANPWDTAEKDLLDKNLTNQAIQTLQDHGYMCIITTSRTAELCMSEKQYHQSKIHYGFSRPQPHIGKDINGKRYYIKPEDILPIKILDLPLIISSTGAQIEVQQKNGGYAEDRSFYPDSFPSPAEWRKETQAFLATLSIPFSYSSIEDEKKYDNGETDVFPPSYRIQLMFTSLEHLLLLSQLIHKKHDMYFVNDSNPEAHYFTGYIMPKNGKLDAINHVLQNLQKPTEILIIGDSLPDLEAGLRVMADGDTLVTFFLVGGSRLSSHTLPPSVPNRNIIVGDIISPGSIGPKSIIEFLRKKSYNDS